MVQEGIGDKTMTRDKARHGSEENPRKARNVRLILSVIITEYEENYVQRQVRLN